ncbi:MAG TPA: hypothetical protein VKY92_19300 [Verrucomicrobiae bacterium]|nr:hypothetical protein [Verrucomicrobiae bacterium]
MKRVTQIVAVMAVIAMQLLSAQAAAVIYQTGFEPSEGYDTNLDLAGQKGWIAAGSGGNGLGTGFFPGKGFQAYIGYAAPSTNDQSLYLYRPINKTLPQVQFSATMEIIDSTTTNRDDFYWSVFNQQGDQLFILDFDNSDLNVYYFLDSTNGTGRIWSGLSFTNGGAYPLSISMDFTSNRWSAVFNGKSVATNQPITTKGAPLNLGDIDVAWAFSAIPGDNYMVFDDYRITATSPPPKVALLGLANGKPALRLTGLNNSPYAVDASTNLLAWVPLQTNNTANGRFDLIDDSAPGSSVRFYRARWVP